MDKERFSLHDCRAASVQLIKRIHSHEWELEFAYRYDGYAQVLYKGWIWEDHEPWSYECELWIGTRKDTVFRWDSPSADLSAV